MKLKIKAGTTSRMARVFIQDATSTTGAGLAGLAFGSSGLKWYFSRVGDTGSTAATLATATVGTFASGGFVAVDGTNMPGVYEIGIPNAALASGSTCVHMLLYGAANMVPAPVEIELDAVDYQDATAFGLARLDAAVTSRMATYAQPTGFLAATFPAGTVASTTNITAGTITTATTATNLTNLPAAPTDWITALSVSAGAVTKAQAGLALASQVPANFTTATFAGAGVFAVAALANAPSGTGASAASIRAEIDANSTQLAAIRAKTDNLPAAPADESLVIAATNAIYARIGAPAGASIAADIQTRSTYAGADTAGTTTLLTRITVAPPSAATIAATTAGAILATPENLLATDASGRVTTGTVGDKTGYALAPSGLDSITATEPVGPSSGWNFRQWLRWTAMRFANASRTPTTLTVKTLAGTTSTTQSVTDDGAGTETTGATS